MNSIRTSVALTIVATLSVTLAGVRSHVADTVNPSAVSRHSTALSTRGKTVNISPGTPGSPTYRVFIQGATGFVSMQSVRDDAEQRATAFCDRKGKAMESLTETTATPPYILGNFPRIEIVFDCADKPGSPGPTASDDRYGKASEAEAAARQRRDHAGRIQCGKSEGSRSALTPRICA